MNVIFDTETTGLPPKGANYKDHFLSYPYIVQLSWKRSDENHVNDYIINNGVNIPKEATDVHGITQEMADASEYSFLDVAILFIEDAIQSEKIIAHNGYFDISIFKANVLRSTQGRHAFTQFNENVIRALHKDKRIDTMMKTISFCSIPFANGRGKKWPKLEELYFKLFNETFNAHNAKDDVLATERCYLELVKQGII